MEPKAEQRVKLPIGVVGRVDLSRLEREVMQLDDFFSQATVRKPGKPVKLPKTSRLLDELLMSNKLNVLMEPERAQLLTFLKHIRTQAPVIHMSFNADPSPLFVQRLLTWLRQEIHPHVLLQVGLQPTIGAGCVMRTTNQLFNFSLKQHFADKHELLATSLGGTSSDG